MSTLSVDTITEKTTGNGVKIAGHVLQVLQATSTTQTSTNSGDRVFSDVTGMSQSITPTSTDSKILVRINISFYINANNESGLVRIVRGSTSIYDHIANLGYTGSSAQAGGVASFEFLDSPSTTSATTYKLQMARNYATGTFSINETFDSNATGSSITLMEIGG